MAPGARDTRTRPRPPSWEAQGVAPRVWKIELVLETDDEDEIERLSGAIARLACDDATDTDHTCRLPWFLITSALDDEEAAAWRGDLNR